MPSWASAKVTASCARWLVLIGTVIVGSFIEPADSVRNSTDVEIKWGVHEAGEERGEWTTGETRTSIMFLISGRFVQKRPDREVELLEAGGLRDVGARGRPRLEGGRGLRHAHDSLPV